MTDAEISKQLFGWLAPVQARSADASLEELYKFFQEAIFDGEGGLKGWGVPFTAIAFKEAKLSNPTERKFFEVTFSKLPKANVDELITTAAGGFVTYSSANDRPLLLATKKALFLLDVWPQRKEEFIRLVPQAVIDSFPRKTKDWTSVRSALLGS
jgi:hypothetical protein